MPVITRSQARIIKESIESSLEQPDYLTSPLPESLTSFSTCLHPTSPTIESLDDCSRTIASTSPLEEHSDHIVSLLPSELKALTSLSDERLNHISIPSLHHDNFVDLPQSESLASTTSNLKFQNSSETVNFPISKYLSLDQSGATQSMALSSHNSAISNISATANDTDEDDFCPGVKVRAQTTQNMMDMDSLFTAIKAHLTDATQQLSGDFRKVVDDNVRFKQEM